MKFKKGSNGTVGCKIGEDLKTLKAVLQTKLGEDFKIMESPQSIEIQGKNHQRWRRNKNG